MGGNTYEVELGFTPKIDILKKKYSKNKTVQLILNEALQKLIGRREHLVDTRILDRYKTGGGLCSIM